MTKPLSLLTTLITLTTLVPADALAASGKYAHSPCTPKSKLPGCVKKAHGTELTPYTPKQYKDHGLADTMTPLGRKARGFYITAYFMRNLGAERIARQMKKANLNAIVVDMKDDFGQVTYRSQVPLSKGQQFALIRDTAAMVKTLKEHGIYTIARMVCFKDSRLPYQRPDLSVRIGPRAERLFNAGANWLDHYSPEVQDYLIDLALELQGFGFDEVQLDYIRFPKGRISTVATWMHAAKDKRDHSGIIAAFLERMDRALTIPMSVDVYGLTTLVDGDPRTLGQTIEQMARYVDAVSPMMYANGMRTYFKNDTVTEHVYNIIRCGLWRARQKAARIVLRPYLQAYPDSVKSFFGPDFIKRQVVAAERAGSNGFLFWNAGMQNGMAYGTLGAMKKLGSFGDNPDQYKEPGNHPGSWCVNAGSIFGGGDKTTKKGAATREKKPSSTDEEG